jgi:gluconolactonase
MAHKIFDSAFKNLLDLDAEPRQIVTGFEFTEGPIWHPAEQFLFFSDIPGNARYAWDAKSGVVEASVRAIRAMA